MSASLHKPDTPVVLVTGAAQRIGAATVRQLHNTGFNVLIHYRRSSDAAAALAAELNTLRAGSAATLSCDLTEVASISDFAEGCLARWGRLDALVNNASDFYAREFESVTLADWNSLIGSNVQGAYFLTQALLPALRDADGCVVNIIDIYAERPLNNYSTYCIAKAGLAMMTRALAKELAPAVRVNGVAPGSILWPDADNAAFGDAEKRALETKVPMRRQGEPQDIANTVEFLIARAPYITGQIIAVDGGRSLTS